MANPPQPKFLDGGVPLEEHDQPRGGRFEIRLLGIALFALLVFGSPRIAFEVKWNPFAVIPFLICASCIGSAIVRPRRFTAILAVGGLLIWLMLRAAFP